MKIKNLVILASIAVCAAACSSGENNSDNADTLATIDTTTTLVTGEATSMCFIRTDGNKDQDTTSVELVIKGDKVTGQMYWHPFEKDSRNGTLSGTFKSDTVNAVWTFMQEGMQDTLALQFLVKDDDLLQKPLKVNTQTGREQTDNSAGFTIAYRPSVSLKKK